MKAKDLYTKLDQDFGIDALKDDWSFMTFNDFISPSFRHSSMGLVLDNTEEVNRVFTATIPDLDVLDQLLDSDLSDVLLFSHHAMGYDPGMEGFPFYDIPEDYLYRLRQKRIAFYVLHTPLDKNGPYSTGLQKQIRSTWSGRPTTAPKNMPAWPWWSTLNLLGLPAEFLEGRYYLEDL